MIASQEAPLARLRAGATAFAGLDPLARASLAIDTASAVVAAADRWVDAAVALKSGGIGARTDAIRAEETATGPLASLRLLAITARVLRELAVAETPRPAAPPRVLRRGDGTTLVGVDVLPERWLADRALIGPHRGTVRCAVPGDAAAFARCWREECRDRPRRGGVAAVLGAGNVTGLAVADAVSQVFEHGRAALLKLHPLHESLLPALRDALAPLVAAGMVELVAGGRDEAAEAIAHPAVTHVHLTGGRAAFDAIVHGPSGPRTGGTLALGKPITCELGGVTPWVVVPGSYTGPQLRCQADLVAASIINNASFNCIATKCVVTCRGWRQRDEFLGRVAERLAAAVPRPAWYPGSAAAWEEVVQRPTPADGVLPWVFRTGVDPEREPRWLEREWFVPVAVEVPLEADGMEGFCTRAAGLLRRLPGTLAASVTIPDSLPPHDAHRVDLFVEHLEYGTIAVNTWSALAYAFASLPWGGFPGGTLADPGSGLGFVHDPLLLPLVHNSILRGPLLLRPTPPWLPWHPHAAALARGVVGVYASILRGGGGLWALARLLPRVLAG